jgi:hypothetical protein
VKGLSIFGHYLLQHIWDVIIAGLIVYEIVVNTVERRREKRATDTIERQPPAIYDGAGHDGQVLISGMHTIGEALKDIERSGMVKIANFLKGPVKICPRYLEIESQKIACRITLHSRATNFVTENVVIPGNEIETFDLCFRFTEFNVPRKLSGKLYLESSNRGKRDEDLFVVEVKFT